MLVRKGRPGTETPQQTKARVAIAARPSAPEGVTVLNPGRILLAAAAAQRKKAVNARVRKVREA